MRVRVGRSRVNVWIRLSKSVLFPTFPSSCLMEGGICVTLGGGERRDEEGRGGGWGRGELTFG